MQVRPRGDSHTVPSTQQAKIAEVPEHYQPIYSAQPIQQAARQTHGTTSI